MNFGKVAVLLGGKSAEREVSLTSGGMDSARVARSLLPVHVRALAALGRPASAERLVESYDRWLTPTSRAQLARSIAFGWVRIGDMTRARRADGRGPRCRLERRRWLAGALRGRHQDRAEAAALRR